MKSKYHTVISGAFCTMFIFIFSLDFIDYISGIEIMDWWGLLIPTWIILIIDLVFILWGAIMVGYYYEKSKMEKKVKENGKT